MQFKEKRKLLKVAILNSGLDRQVAKACGRSFRENDRSDLDALEEAYGLRIVHMAKSLNNARYKRKQRVARKVEGFASYGYCIFLTLTFNDATLESTSEKTRRTYVSRYLKSQSAIYIANIDYGGKKGREHYHALILADRVDFKPWLDNYGFIFSEKVHTSTTDVEKVSKYVSKLSNHAMKVNDGVAPRLIYSREGKAIKDFFANEY